MKRNISILGSTGSIGESTLRVVDSLDKELQIVGLAAHKSVDKLLQQINKFRPSVVGIVEEKAARELRQKLNGMSVRVYDGPSSLEAVATLSQTDVVVAGVVGAAGLPALLAALKSKKIVALANKESLIMAGKLVTETARRYGSTILPVDSEHSAMFQCLQGQDISSVRQIILTASGGPFYRYEGDLSNVTVEQALAHPNWVMGKKITIDSATLMNKGLEAIEAHHLFGIPIEKIKIVIHPQSIVHSAVEFNDGSIIAQLSQPDMCLPIQYALTYPKRLPCPIKPLNLTEVGRLDFAEPDFSRFPCLELALSAGRTGGTMPTVLSASNEKVVGGFLQGRIKFTDIPRIVHSVMNKHKSINQPNLEEIQGMDQWAREETQRELEKV